MGHNSVSAPRIKGNVSDSGSGPPTTLQLDFVYITAHCISVDPPI